MAIRTKQAGLFATAKDAEIVDVEDRKTDELVLGLVGPIGSGISFSANIVSELLRTEFGYAGEVIKVSDIINQSAAIIGGQPVALTDEKRTEKLQRLGTKLREDFGHTYLVEKVVGRINLKRGSAVSDPLPKARRYFTIIDSNIPMRCVAFKRSMERRFG